MRRRTVRATALVVGLALTLAALVLGSGSAAAAPTESIPGVGCQVVNNGQRTADCGVTGFLPGSTVTVTGSDGATIGVCRAKSDGTCSVQGQVPCGRSTVTARSGSLQATTQVTTTCSGVGGVSAGPGPSAASPSSGGLSSTGVAVFAIAAVGLVLILGGIALVVSGRRRRYVA